MNVHSEFDRTSDMTVFVVTRTSFQFGEDSMVSFTSVLGVFLTEEKAKASYANSKERFSCDFNIEEHTIEA